MNTKEALYRYRHRDAIEKLFEVSKSFLGEDSFRVHNTESLHSKQQLLFLAEILRNEVFNGLSELREKDKATTVEEELQNAKDVDEFINSLVENNITTFNSKTKIYTKKAIKPKE